jgi:plasmid maintenance system antidote protein VapI
MNAFELNSPPATFAPAVKAGWLEDVTADPRAGEIWMLSWDGKVAGLALVTSVLDDYFRAMPITLGEASASAGEAILPSSYLGEASTIWYRAETGLGMFLLHRRLLPALSSNEVQQLRRAAYAGEPAPFEPGRADPAAARAGLAVVLDGFNALCHLEWPSAAPSEGVLNTALLAELNISTRDVARVAELPVPEALAVWRQDWAVSGLVASKLSEAYGIDEEDLLVVAADTHTKKLSAPRVKSRVVQLTQVSGLGERAARNRTRQEMTVSGRTDSVASRNSTLVEDTLDRLIVEYRDAADSE